MNDKNLPKVQDGEILIYQTEDGKVQLDVRLENESLWLTQPLMAELFQTSIPNISMHIRNIYEEGELEPEATVKKFLTVRQEGLENRAITTITPKERITLYYWNPIALREAVINAIIHNDYTGELVPKFEIFADRIEMTSVGIIHPGKEQEDFFAGYSMPRNKTLMRIFKDLGMVEYLGSGLPRILEAYPKDSYTFASRFVRVAFPIDEEVFQAESEKPAPTSPSEASGKMSVKSSVKGSGKVRMPSWLVGW